MRIIDWYCRRKGLRVFDRHELFQDMRELGCLIGTMDVKKNRGVIEGWFKFEKKYLGFRK